VGVASEDAAFSQLVEYSDVVDVEVFADSCE
jgi:hypothetical protein